MLNTCQDKTRQKTIQTSFFGDFPSTNDTFKETLFKQGVFTPRENISTHSLVSKHWHETVNEHIVTPIKEIDRRLRQPVLNGIYSIEHAKELEQFWSKTRKEKITFFLPALDIYFFKCFQDGLKDLSEEELIDFFLTPSSYADEDEEEIVEAIECSVDALLNDTIIQALFEGLFVIHPIIYGDVVPINRLSDVSLWSRKITRVYK